MRIRTLLVVTLSASLLLLLFLLAAIWTVGTRLDRFAAAQTRAQSLVNDVSALLILTNELALYGEARAQQQWQSRHRSILAVLEHSQTIDATTPGEALVQAKVLSHFFEQLAVRQNEETSPWQQRRTRFLINQLLSRTQLLFDTVDRWGDAAGADRLKLEHDFRLLSMAIPLIMLVLLASLVWLLVRRVLRPLSALHQTVQTFAMGNLSARCGVDSNDELGEVARTFDLMAGTRQSIELELQQAKVVAESASEAKSQFLANMSHEIRTPMNAVLGLLQLLQQTALNAQQQDYALKAYVAGKSLLGIINDILDFSKVEAGKLVIEHTAFRLDDLLRDLSAVLFTSVEAADLAVTFDLDPSVPTALYGDSLRLQQVLLNLVGNAIKFTPKGEVVLSVRPIALTTSSVRIEFAVKDSGIGIAPDKLAHIFEGFSQAESSTTRRFGGTGLGLTISLRLVRLMGGELRVESEPGRGSRFSFCLDFSRDFSRDQEAHEAVVSFNVAPKAPPTTPRRGSSRLGGLHLLLVEDNLLNQQVARELLTNEGAFVKVADNGRQAVALVERAPEAFDAVLMDVQMPEMDGYEATRYLRDRLKLTALPILAMTANAMAEDQAACIAAGMNDHVGKPIDLEKLVQVLLKHCRVDAPVASHAATPDAQPLPPMPDGFHLAEALQRLGGNRRVYADMARGFCLDQGDAVVRIRGHLHAGDLKAARLDVHSLKGVAATLGALPLAQQAAALEARIAHGTAISATDEALVALSGTLEHAVDTLTHCAAELDPPTSPTTSLDTAQACALLDELASLLAKNNLRAMDVYAKLRDQGIPDQGENLAVLDAAMRNMDFPAALELCNRLRQSLA